MALEPEPRSSRERNAHDTQSSDPLRTEQMLIVSPRPPVRSNLVGVLRDGGFAAEGVADLVQAQERLDEIGDGETQMVVVDARITAGVDPWDGSVLSGIARAVPALLVIADESRRAAFQVAVAPCPRGLVLDRLDLISVLVCAEMLMNGRMPPGLRDDAAARGDAAGAGDAAPVRPPQP